MNRKPYQKLEIWEKGMQLSKLIYKYTQNFPPEERYGLRSQMRDASVSIPSNSAEGSRRSSDRDFANFILIARGSLAELETQTLLAHEISYLSDERKDELMQKCEELSKMLRAFHNRLNAPQTASSSLPSCATRSLLPATRSSMPRLTSPTTDFPQWYLDCVERADLAEYAPVKGCIVFKPYGYAIWEAMQRDLDRRIKDLGVQNAYFPLFIPESVMSKEAEHVEGFAPECAVVTHGGGKELPEKLYIRPTSETIIYATFAKWIQSHRDLPLKINQWANIVRWEMRTRPFLRTLEFLWQEGHTAHALKGGADKMAEDVLQMYIDFDREMLGIPVVSGLKPDHEKFAGALYTLTTEALARDGKAIQAGTSHNLGQGFSEAYDVSFLDEDGKAQRPWMTSWGVSTRLIGTLIVVHGDEKGLRLPPSVAPTQVVVVPIYKSDAERVEVLKACDELVRSLEGVRITLDDRDDKSPGFKFNEWEVKGVPLRVEVGPKDLKEKKLTVVRRDTGEKQQVERGKWTVESVQSMLEQVQQGLFDQAKDYVDSHTHEAESFDQLKRIIDGDGGFVWAPWDGELASAEKVQDETKASIRLLGDAKDAKGKKDLVSGKDATEWVVYAKAY